MDRYQIAADVVRDRDRDRYLADLFISEPARRHVFALHAFNAEIVRIRGVVTEPVLGEVRQQWWRDVLAGRTEAAGNPLAETLLETIAAFKLPVAPLLALIDARTFDLYNDPMPNLADFEGYAGETTSALFQLAALVLATGTDPGSADASGHAGVAMGLAEKLTSLAADARRRQLFLPRDRLEAHGVTLEDVFAGGAAPALAPALAEFRTIAGDHLQRAVAASRALPESIRPAFLPLALVEADLRRLGRSAALPLASPREMAQWRRQWILWRAARRWRR